MTKTWNRPLMALVAAMAVLTVVTAVATFTDDRVLLGAPIWLKPFKFSVSFTLYAATLAWMLSLLPRRSRAAEWSAVFLVGGLLVEIAVIAGQVIRGQASHFNESTPLNAALYDAMAAASGVLFIGQFVIAVAVLRARIANRVVATGIRMGLGAALAGMLVAVPMTMQVQSDDVTGAHTIGAPDGGPGLPVVGWSTVAGDLRIGHFVGLHAMQALPILAMLLGRFAGRLDERTKVRLLRVAGLAYVGLILILTWQALRGQSVIRPDALTLGVAGILIAVTATAATAVLSRRQSELALAA
ncbi:hypothetical protein AB0M20_11305 [Actinoplanes sp. NPDC051633]|uniref:hypothetical protein n=1 Tax=Actinoplanes sp. NPDC051633 TaxID=3155670 RepID=UPI0034343214